MKCFRDYQDEVTLACKISAYVLPAITVGLSQIEAVTEITSLYFILGNGIREFFSTIAITELTAP